MNLSEAVKLLDAISDFDFKSSEKPNFSVYDRQTEGVVLCVKANLVTEEYLRYLKKIIESYKLGIRKSEEYLIIYG